MVAAAVEFGDLGREEGIGQLNSFLATRSYITGYSATQDDNLTVAKVIRLPSATTHPHAHRWHRHISSFSAEEQATWPVGVLKPELKAKREKAPPPKEEDDIDLFGEDEDEGELEALKAKKKEAAGKSKKQVVNKSSLVIEVKPASVDTDLDEVARLAKAIQMEGLVWGESVKKIPVAFGLFKLQLSCVILDDVLSTTELTDELEALGMDEEQRERLRRRQECGAEDEDEEEPEGLVQSAEIVSFNKL